jgi:hypothetical protein
MRRINRIALAAALFLSSVGFAARPAAGSETWVHKGGRASGVINTLACEPVPDASITFSGKRLTQHVTPDRAGRFIVELPAGKYQVSVSTPGGGEVTSEALGFYQAKNGELQLSIDTGRWTHPGCFEESPEDLLIPDERGVVSDGLPGKPPASKP